jgi:hypothetical protein
LEHAATNVKEEIGGTASDVAKIIAGANVTSDTVSDAKGAESFVSLKLRTPGVSPSPDDAYSLGLHTKI